ncbi:MAG: VOC family protein [Bacteroidetes bacterium]|nr:VOC family protein [Bacteroidota bacterium]MCL2303164.1 VOC family protein [Lentimicrobiaceae bacterium]
MAKVNVYLTFNGNCEAAFNFYKSIFGGEFCYIGKWSDMPPQEGMPPLSEENRQRVMHVGLPISEETILLGCDNMKEHESYTTFGNNFSILLSANSKEEADKFFALLSEGGNVVMPMQEQFWGDYFGMCADKFGINWMVDFDKRATQ